MVWRLGMVAALGVLFFLGSPAAAAIQRQVDSRGVLHISNTTSGSRPVITATATLPGDASPGAELPASRPEVPVSQAQAANPKPQVLVPPAPSEATITLSADLADSDAVQVAGEAPLAPQPAGETVVSPRPSLQRVAFPVAAPGTGREAVSRPGAARTEVGAGGGIRSFRDRQGVLHISNEAPPEGQPARSAPEVDPEGPGLRSLAWDGTGSGGPLQKVSWEAAAVAPAAGGPVSVTGAIRRYRDAQGILHIDNAAPEDPETAPAPRLARSGKLPKLAEISGPDEVPIFPLKKAAYPGEALARAPSPGSVREVAPPKGELLPVGSIRHYRDAKGVLHLETVEPPAPEPLPGPSLVARGPPGTPGGLANALKPPGPGPSGVPGAASEILVSRDRRGHLIIRNREPELQVAGVPSREQALAQLAPVLQEASVAYGLPVSLIQALIRTESNFVSVAVSPKGAMGLMQLMPGTAEFLGVKDAFDPRENILGGCRYMRLLLDYFGGSLPLALAAYNAGYTRVVSCGYQIPPIKETQEFVTVVLGRYFAAEKQGRRTPWI